MNIRTHIKIFHRLIRCCVLLVVFGLVSGCFPNYYYTSPIKIQVIDSVSGKPVSGVVAAAEWRLYGFYPGYRAGSAEFMETVSDEQGYIRLPSMGPKFFLFRRGSAAQNPTIYLYKYKYRVTRFHINNNNVEYYGNLGPDAIRIPDKVELQKFTGSDKDYNDHLNGFFSIIARLLLHMKEEGKPCAWKKLPRTIALDANRDMTFPPKGQDPNLPWVFNQIRRYNCGSPEDVLPKDILEMRLIP